MSVRIRFRRFYDCDTEAERSLEWGPDSVIYTYDTFKYFKIFGGAFVEIPPDEVVFTSPIPITKIAISGVPDGTKFLRDDGSWAVPAGTGGGGGGWPLNGTAELTSNVSIGGSSSNYNIEIGAIIGANRSNYIDLRTNLGINLDVGTLGTLQLTYDTLGSSIYQGAGYIQSYFGFDSIASLTGILSIYKSSSGYPVTSDLKFQVIDEGISVGSDYASGYVQLIKSAGAYYLNFDDTAVFGGQAHIKFESTGSSYGELTITNSIAGTTGPIYITAASVLTLTSGDGDLFSGMVFNSAGDIELIPSGVIKLTTTSTVGNVWTATGTDGSGGWAAPAGGAPAWLLASGGALTGANTITSNTANWLNFTGTWTATANNQYHTQFGGSLTGRATIADTLIGYNFNPTITAGANDQVLRAIVLNPTFVIGGFTNTVNNALVVGGSGRGILINSSSTSINFERPGFQISNITPATGIGSDATDVFWNSAATGGFVFETNSNRALHIQANGNIAFSAAGSPTASTRFDVRGIGTTSGSFSFRVANSSNSEIFKIRDDGLVLIPGGGSSNPSLLFGNSTDGQISRTGLTGGLTIYGPSSSAIYSWSIAAASSNNYSTPSGNSGMLALMGNFIPSFGTGNLYGSNAIGTINMTGTSSGNVIVYGNNQIVTAALGNYTGFDHNPTVTSITGTHLAWRNTSGNVLIGHTTLGATTTRLQVRGIGNTTGSLALFEDSGGVSRFNLQDNGLFSFVNGNGSFSGTNNGELRLQHQLGSGDTGFTGFTVNNTINYYQIAAQLPGALDSGTTPVMVLSGVGDGGGALSVRPVIEFRSSNIALGGVMPNGRWLFGGNIGTANITGNTRLDIRGTATTTNLALRIADSSNAERFSVRDDGHTTVTHNNVNSLGFRVIGQTSVQNENVSQLQSIVTVTGIGQNFNASNWATFDTSNKVTFNFVLRNAASSLNANSAIRAGVQNTTGNLEFYTTPGDAGGLSYIGKFTLGTTLLLGGAIGDPATSNTRLDIRGIGTTTNNNLRLANSSNQTQVTITDAGNMYFWNGTKVLGTGDGSNLNLVTNNTTLITLGSARSVSFLNSPATGNGVNWHTYTETARSNGWGQGIKYEAGGHTGLLASTESTDIYFDLGRVVQWLTGALAIQRAFVIEGPSYAFAGASTLTKAVTFSITNAPISSTNATITTSIGFEIEASTVAGSGTVGTAYAAYFNTPSGATINYGLGFSGKMHIASVPTNDNALTEILGRDSTTGEVKYRSAASLGGGGITNGAVNTELMMSDGTNSIASTIFYASDTLSIGSGAAGATRYIQAAGSASDVALTLLAKGTGDATLGTIGTGRAMLAAGGGWQLNAWNFISGAVAQNNIFGNSTSGTNANNAGDILIRGGGTTSTVANRSGSVVITSGIGNGTNSSSGHIYMDIEAVTGSGVRGNIGLFSTSVANWQAMEKGLFVGDALTEPTGNPSSGFFAYSWLEPEGRSLKVRTSDGHIGKLILQKKITIAGGTTLRAIGSAPQTLIAAQGSNKYINVINVNVSYNYGSVVYNFGAGASPLVRFTGGSTGMNMAVGDINGAADINRNLSPYASGFINLPSNTALVIGTADNSDATTGDGDLDVVIYYTIENQNT